MTTESYMSAEQALPTIREAVADCYHVRLQVLNGGPWYQNEQYRIRMEVSPDVIACAIQNNIEGALIAENGAEQGVIDSAEMLSAMLSEDISTGGLSDLGVTVMDELFKSLAEMARDMAQQGDSPFTKIMNQLIH
ncbi:hypothetical protein [uncultured Tolumonas sp.]|uniref:hypothetical protein n=1 Tax=uncultured Tolumonas sp. TaxID=263765 RepID=UPI00292E735F|nr:hypothetical protein [uncultured Tolumonas sp.]